MKKIFHIIMVLPNLPFMLLLGIYMVYMIIKHSSIVEMELAMDKGEILTDDIKKWLKTMYPKWLIYTVGTLTYLLIIKNLL